MKTFSRRLTDGRHATWHMTVKKYNCERRVSDGWTAARSRGKTRARSVVAALYWLVYLNRENLLCSRMTGKGFKFFFHFSSGPWNPRIRIQIRLCVHECTNIKKSLWAPTRMYYILCIYIYTYFFFFYIKRSRFSTLCFHLTKSWGSPWKGFIPEICARR